MGKNLNKYIFKQVRNACLDYGLIENGDRIAVGASGGKDSVTLLHFLKLLQKYTPLKFEIIPIYLDLGWANDITGLQELCKGLELELVVEQTNIGYVVFEARHESNPCSLCSNLRRGALNRKAKSLHCNKVALGHHMDDAVTTLLMSMIFEGQFHVFKPLTYLDRMDITVIRPLVYVAEKDIRTFCSTLPYSLVKNKCPADGYTRRTEIEEIVREIEGKYPGARKRLFSALSKAQKESFWTSN
jgi:tRNA 2-thiocytidine biosynthesis protein TtcA